MKYQMEYAKHIVDFLGKALGKDFEIVLQDVVKQEIIAIANGEVSGRKVGSPLTDFAIKMIASENWKENDCQLNYIGKTSDGKILRSSTYFIKDEEAETLLGMLCININISRYKEVNDIIAEMAGVSFSYKTDNPEDVDENEKALPLETFSASLGDMIAKIINKMLEQHGNIPVNRLSKSEKMEIIQQLNDEGIFLMKGAIGIVAHGLECSESTIYRYLNKTK